MALLGAAAGIVHVLNKAEPPRMSLAQLAKPLCSYDDIDTLYGCKWACKDWCSEAELAVLGHRHCDCNLLGDVCVSGKEPERPVAMLRKRDVLSCANVSEQ